MPAGIHMFRSTEEAYDACQCGNDFKGTDVNRGDLLIIPSKGVVGMVDTWPIALTYAGGELHSLSNKFTLLTAPDNHLPILKQFVKDENIWSRTPDISLPMLLRRVRTAKRIIKNKGWSLAPYVDVE